LTSVNPSSKIGILLILWKDDPSSSSSSAAATTPQQVTLQLGLKLQLFVLAKNLEGGKEQDGKQSRIFVVERKLVELLKSSLGFPGVMIKFFFAFACLEQIEMKMKQEHNLRRQAYARSHTSEQALQFGKVTTERP
jgi:hypothetical protein